VTHPLPVVAGQAGTILVVDDVNASLQLLSRLLVSAGYVVLTARDGLEALEMVEAYRPDLLLMDVRMPRLGGIEACRRLKQDAATRLIPIVLMTGFAEPEDRIQAIEAGADDFLAKPVDRAELKARVRSLVRLKRYTDELDSAEAIILSLAMTIEARDPCTVGHCQRMAAYAEALGRRLGLPDEDLASLKRGAYLHDIGKIAVPDAILMKPGPLTAAEYALMKEHTVAGDRLCGNLLTLRGVRPIIRHHHELCDGSGYPDGLAGDEIPLLAQITGIVDVYDAVTSVRPYKPAYSAEAAVAVLREDVARGRRRGGLVEPFVEALEAGETGLHARA